MAKQKPEPTVICSNCTTPAVWEYTGGAVTTAEGGKPAWCGSHAPANIDQLPHRSIKPPAVVALDE